MLSGILIICFIISDFTNPIKVKAKNSCKYAKTTVNIRSSPSKKSKIVGQVYWNDKINIIKKKSKNWYQINFKNKKRYIHSKYLRDKKCKYKSFCSPSSKTFKSYEDAKCITNSKNIPQGKLKSKYHLDYQSGVWMVGNRYCIAVGSYYTKSIGVKIDLLLSHNGRRHTLKCITADCKADKDTIKNHRIHKDRSVVEFIVKTSYLPSKVKLMGDVSYVDKKFNGRIEKIRVYK